MNGEKVKKMSGSQQLLLLKPKSMCNWDLWEPVVRFSILVFGITIIAIALKQNMLFHWEFYQIPVQIYLLQFLALGSYAYPLNCSCGITADPYQLPGQEYRCGIPSQIH